MQYKGQHKPIAQIARELNVDAVVEGTVLKSGSQVRITAQLIQAPLDRHLWAKSYEGDLHDILSLQDNVASAIAQEIQAAVTPQEQALLTSAHPVNPEAYEDYMQGRYFWNKRDDGALERAIEYFQKATSIDSNYAPAYAGLAQTYVLLAGNTGPKDEFVAAGKKSATQALSLDPNLSEAHTALALLLGDEYNFTDEEKEFKLAVTAVTLDSLAYAYGLSGDRTKANAQLHSLLARSRQRNVSPWAIGFVYLGLGISPTPLTGSKKPYAHTLPIFTGNRSRSRWPKVIRSVSIGPSAIHESGHFYFAQTGHSHFAATRRLSSLTCLRPQPKMAA
jgi:tetratricopeptide (TPR) repeat protein